MARKGSMVGVYFNQKDIAELGIKFKELMLFKSVQVNKEVAKKTLEIVNASGKIPYKTGALRNASTMTKDKFSENGYIFGWVGLPYARKVYFGASTKTRFVTIEGKRRKGKYYANGTQPFWDRPTTRNKLMMLAIYRQAARKAFK